MFLITQADLPISNEDIEDEDQHFILNEMVRFFAHPSAGVKGFDSMPAAWADVAQKVVAGAPLQAKSGEVQEVVDAGDFRRSGMASTAPPSAPFCASPRLRKLRSM